jgi:hypothetical protein
MTLMQNTREIMTFLRKIDALNATVVEDLFKIKVKIADSRINIWCHNELLAHRTYANTAYLRGSKYKIQIAVGGQPDVPERIYHEHSI